jgi:hypothetical protein
MEAATNNFLGSGKDQSWGSMVMFKNSFLCPLWKYFLLSYLQDARNKAKVQAICKRF